MTWSIALNDTALTPAERQCLAYAAEGCAPQEIARRLGIDRDGVQAHFAAARRKLGAFTLLHAITRAVKRGLIQIDPDETRDGQAGKDRADGGMH
jgi:DNA-binding CsgD family transcriptional regulator